MINKPAQQQADRRWRAVETSPALVGVKTMTEKRHEPSKFILLFGAGESSFWLILGYIFLRPIRVCSRYKSF
jgi:hypothetical protein